MEQLLATRDRMQHLAFESNSVMELRLLVLSALNHIMRLHIVCPDAQQRTIYKDAFRVMKHNYKIIESAQEGDAWSFGNCRAKALNAMDELMMQLCILEAKGQEAVPGLSLRGQVVPAQLQLRIA